MCILFAIILLAALTLDIPWAWVVLLGSIFCLVWSDEGHG